MTICEDVVTSRFIGHYVLSDVYLELFTPNSGTGVWAKFRNMQQYLQTHT